MLFVSSSFLLLSVFPPSPQTRATHECQSPKSFSPLTISHSARPNALEISLPLPSFVARLQILALLPHMAARSGSGRLWIKDNTYQNRLHFLLPPSASPDRPTDRAILMSILAAAAVDCTRNEKTLLCTAVFALHSSPIYRNKRWLGNWVKRSMGTKSAVSP